MTTQPATQQLPTTPATRSAGLCFRCEHRARYLETGERPRYECGNADSQVYGCYMYQPCLPVIVTGAPDALERRPFDAPLFAGRVHAVRVAAHTHQPFGARATAGAGDVAGTVHSVPEGLMVTWTPIATSPARN